MEATLIRFIDALRTGGVRVSLSENLDCFEAVGRMGIEDKPVFRATLAATLVKQVSDMPTFYKLFDLFFTDLRAITDRLQQDQEAPENRFGDLSMQEFLEAFMREHPEAFERMQEFLANVEPGRFQLFMDQQRQEVGFNEIQNPLQVGFYTRKIRENMGWAEMEEELAQLQEQLRAEGLTDQEIERVMQYLERQMQRFLEAAKNVIRMELEKNEVKTLDISTAEDILNKTFYQLNAREMAVLREIVTKLGRKLRDKLILRRKRLSRGTLDVRKTIRENMQVGGIPIDLHFKQKRREKPQIMALVDISDSVSHVARFMLQFVYAIQDFFAKVRTFVFVSQLGEVTELFHQHDLQEAIELALHSKSVDYYGHSNFGQAFYTFHEKFLEAVTSKTTVIIIGDARNNRNDPKAWCVKRIQERAKRVIWLNPEARSAWRLGDSVMYDYEPHCDEVHECRNAKQLLNIVDTLIAK